MKNGKRVLLILVLAVLLVFLLNPEWCPLFGADVQNAVRTHLQSIFGILAGGEGAGIFTPARLVSASAVLAFMLLVITLLCWILELVSKGRNRSETVAGLLSSMVKVVGGLVTLVWVLNVLGVNLAAIFASLGVVSLIVGFGVQSLIEDCVTGVFIILENEYNVGDIIVVDDFRGTVRRISIRTTVIEDDGGNQKVINNADIRNIQNRSRCSSWALVNVGIAYEADLTEVESILVRELPGILERHPEVFRSAPVFSGVQELADSAVVLRVKAEVGEENIYMAQRILNRELKCILDNNSIPIPFPQVVVHQA